MSIVSSMLALVVKERVSGSADDLRNGGFVPAVVYGRKEASMPIAIDARQLAHIYKEAGHSAVVTLKGAGSDKDTLIKDVQVHPVTGHILHADFYALEKGKKVHLSIPLEFTGEAPAEKAGHIIIKALHELEIEVAPQDLPHSLAVALSKLENVGDQIFASQIPLPSSATLKTGGLYFVVSVTAFVEEKEEAPTPAHEEGEAAEATTPEATTTEAEEQAAA